MSDTQDQNLAFKIAACPICHANGTFDGRSCQTCRGFGEIGLVGNRLLVWEKKISHAQIAQDNIFQTLSNAINVLLFLFGTAGIIMAAWVLFAIVNANIPIWYIFQIRNWQLLIFWCSLLTDSYIIYRFNHQLEKLRYIPARSYDAETGALPLFADVITRIPRQNQISISELYTVEALQSVIKAWQLANKYRDSEVRPIHLLIALLTIDQTQIIFSRLGVPFDVLKNKIVHVLSRQLPSESSAILSTQFKEILFDAYILAFQLHQRRVGVTELLESLALQNNEVKELLYDLNIDHNKIINVSAWLRIRSRLRENWRQFRHRASLRPKDNMNRSMTAIATPVLDTFSQDLTLLARAGYLLPCIGREKEIRDIFNIMTGSGRRSPLLIGNPGVGKNTIIEGIAQRMVAEDVPAFLRDKRLVSISVAALVSGASPAQAQQRLMMLLTEVRRSGNIILCIDDIHSTIGITAGRAGSIDLADVLAQALGSETVICLATTTPPEYRRYLEGKSSLDTVLEKVTIEEASGNEAIQILESKAGTIEYKNNAFFSYDSVAEIVRLSDRYLHDRYLPEKAIQIMQEVAQRVHQQRGKNSTITANDVAALISEKTNIPLASITKAESEKLLNLEDQIHQRMVDQEEAVSMVATSLRRARAEMRDVSRPIVNLLFLGPTGVGKTELAKTVAEVYFGAEENMIRLDMSEYQDKTSINRLIGAPPGYSDSSSGGLLTEAVRKNPFSLVLLDEIEKANSDILNLFLQVMDDGRLTDNTGRTVDFTNTIMIATSNAGTAFIQSAVRAGQPLAEIKNLLIQNELGHFFRPEFLNRFDGVIVFKPLSLEDVKKIAGLLLQKTAKNLDAKGIGLQVSEAAIAELAQLGFDQEFGARPLRRVIQQKIQDPIANAVLAGNVGRRDTISIDPGCVISIHKASPL